MRRAVLFGALLLVLVGFLSVRAAIDGSHRLERGDAAVLGPRAGAAATAADPGSAGVERAAADAVGGAARVGPSAGDAGVASVARAPVDRGVRVRVALEGGARDGEVVRLWLVTGGAARIRWERSRATLRERARRGEAFAVDARGEAWIPRQARPYRIAVDGDEHFGFRDVDPGLDEVDVEAAWCPPLVVRVVDADGAPVAGMAVDVDVSSSDGDAERQRAVTDAQGWARIDDVLARVGLDRAERELAADPRARVRVEAFAPIGPAVVEAPWSDALRAPPVVRLPPGGRIEVGLWTPEGERYAPLHGEVRVREVLSGRPARAPEWLAGFEGSTATLPAVGLGRTFEIEVDADRIEIGGPRRVEGPRAPGETVTVRVEPPGSMRVVVARVLSGGRPVAGEALHVRFEESGRTLSGRASLDRDGRTALWIPDRWRPRGPWAIELTRSEYPSRAARIALAGDLPNGRTDAGDVQLAEAPLLAAGTVRDRAGLPVEGARVFAARADAGPAADALALPAFVSGRGGAFAVHGRVAGDDALVLWASSEAYAPVERVCAARGARDVEVLVQRRGELEIALLVPRAASSHDFVVRLDHGPEGEGWQDAQHRKALGLEVLGVDDPGGWRIELRAPSLAPRAYDVEVRFDGEVLAAFSGVRVESGDASRDPRLDPLDLRPRLHLTTVEVRGADGAPIAECRYRWRPSGTLDWRRSEAAESTVRVVSASLPIDVEIWAPDHAARTLTGIAGEHALTLER